MMFLFCFVLGFGKRERTRERRLLKGFNIGLVEKSSPDNDDRISEHDGSGIFQLITNRSSLRRRYIARKRWTTAITTILKGKGANPIGFTNRRHSSLRDLRENVYCERESTVEEYMEDDFQLMSESENLGKN